MRGITTGKVTCKKCPRHPKFDTISDLRRHQWKKHSDSFLTASGKLKPKNWEKARLKKKRAALEKAREVLAEKRRLGLVTYNRVGRPRKTPLLPAPLHQGELIPLVNGSTSGELTLSQAIGILSERHTFLGDVVTMLRGLSEQHTKQNQ